MTLGTGYIPLKLGLGQPKSVRPIVSHLDQKQRLGDSGQCSRRARGPTPTQHMGVSQFTPPHAD